MATGSWELKLREDTPRAIRDAIQAFSMVAIFPSAVPVTQDDASVLAAARFVGIVHKPGPQLTIAGPGLAAWLGQEEISYDVTGAAVLPETLAQSTAGSSLNAWLDDIICPGTPFTRGTTGPAGTMKGAFQWITPRELLDTVAAHFGAEWRIRNTLKLDVAAYTTLYGSTPTVVITRNTSGRDISYKSIEADVSSAVDVADFASRVVVLGNVARAASGGSSTYKGPSNVAVKAVRVVNSPDVPVGSESAAAASYVALFNSARREVKLSTRHYDVSGDIGVGSLVYLYDPESGIVDSSTVILFRGEAIRPVVVRCQALSWGVSRGMGVALRTYDGSVVWTDLTPYIEFEDGTAEIEIGAAQQYVQGDQLSLRADMQPRLAWAPWVTYDVEWRATTTNPTLGNGAIAASYRRFGTSCEVRITLTVGSTSTLGVGSWGFTLPPNIAPRTTSGSYAIGSVLYVDAGLNAYNGSCFVAAGDTTAYLLDGSSPALNASAAVPFAWGASDSVNVSISFEVDP